MWDTILSVWLIGMVPAAMFANVRAEPPHWWAQFLLLTLTWPLWVAAYIILWLTAQLLPWLW